MLNVVSTSGSEPVTLDDAKRSARMDETESELDALIGGYITAAREQAEQITGRRYRPQVLRTELVDWPAADDVIAVWEARDCAVSYWNGTAFVSLSSSLYMYAASGRGTVLAPLTGATWPTLGDRPVGARVRIDLTAGPETPDAVPESVKLFIMAAVAAWADNPEAAQARALQVSPLFERLLDGEKLYG